MDFAPLLAAIALIWKVVDLLKQVRVRDWNAVATQVVTWAAGVLIFWLLANTNYADGIRIGDLKLATLNGASLVLLGLSAGSVGSVAYDFKRAFDNTDSAAQPALVTGEVPVVPPPTIDADHPDSGVMPVTARRRRRKPE